MTPVTAAVRTTTQPLGRRSRTITLMGKRLGVVVGLLVAVTVVGGGTALAGLAGDTARATGAAAGSELRTDARTAELAVWYGRGAAYYAVGDVVTAPERAVGEAAQKAPSSPTPIRPTAGHPVEDALQAAAEMSDAVAAAVVSSADTAAAELGAATARVAGLADEL